jgi:hypothetical protein
MGSLLTIQGEKSQLGLKKTKEIICIVVKISDELW